jgi:D-3-phosphoglycerate dehydrogenase
MKIVVADMLHTSAIKTLGALCDEVVVDPSLSGDALVEACRDADVLVVRSTRVEASVIEQSRKLSLIVRGGAGVNTIDVAAAANHAVFVANCPGKNAVAVAELAIGLIVALDRRIADNVASFRAGKWDKKAYSKALGLRGRTVGIVGLGRIGVAFLQRCRAFEMNPIGWSRSLTDKRAEELGVERVESLEALFERADVISIHLASAPETRSLVGADLLRRMKPGSILINTSRAEIVDEAALIEAAEMGGIRVGIDVPANEPREKQTDFESPLAHPDIYVTHHIGASTEEAQEAVATEVARVIEVFLRTGRVPNCVNLNERTDAASQLVVRHEDQVGVLASVLERIRRDEINVQEMENVIFDGANAACCFLRLSRPPSTTLLAAIDALPHVLGVNVQD